MSEEICQHKYCAIPNMQTKLGLPDLYKIQKKNSYKTQFAILTQGLI